jgi:hypothetical protein
MPHEQDHPRGLFMEHVTPWLVSASLHAGILVVLLFVVVTVQDTRATPPPPQDPNCRVGLPTDTQGPTLKDPDGRDGLKNTLMGPIVELPPGPKDGWKGDPTSPNLIGTTLEPVKGTTAIDMLDNAYGPGRKRGDISAIKTGTSIFGDPNDSSRGGGPKDGIRIGDVTRRGIKAHQVAFVIDYSGSMMSSFDEVRAELKTYLFRLSDEQAFHVVFFAGDSFQENSPKRLVKADENNKRQAAEFLGKINPAGYGSSPIPALAAAFKALRAGDDRDKVLYLVSDGEFDTSGYTFKGADGTDLGGTEAVMAWLRANNKDHAVRVCPVVIGQKPDERGEQGLKTIAKENGGEYRFVQR